MKEILEMAEYHQRKPVNVIFADPNFMGNPRRVDRLCDLLMKHDLNIEFCALVRADAMAKYPEIVKKMCRAGILKFEMGIESPNSKDLKSTKKGITNRVHGEAVRNIRENGGRAGGTFVIGLPDQTDRGNQSFSNLRKRDWFNGCCFRNCNAFSWDRILQGTRYTRTDLRDKLGQL